MKYSWILISLLFILINFSGCKHQKQSGEEYLSKEFYAEDSVVHDRNSPLSLAPGKQPTINYESKTEQTHQQKNGGTLNETVVLFKDQDFSELSSFRLAESEMAEVPSTYSELMEKVSAKNGLILSGYAHGIREGHWSSYNISPYTITQFHIEKVYYGEWEKDSITILENYCPVSENDRNYIEYDGYLYTQLKDRQKVLLLLVPTKQEGVYTPCYYELPLPEDYQTFNATTEQELLGYYRGDSSLIVQKEESNAPIEYVDENGLIIQQFQYQENVPSSDSTLTKEEFSKKMNEHILVRLSLDYKIKIWPKNHLHFSVTNPGYARGGLELLS